MKPRTFLVFFVLFIILALTHADGQGFWRRASSTATLALNGRTLLVEVADTDAERIRGLSGRAQLGVDEGMLFVFPRSGRYGFWMKEMRFPIDIVWLEDASPANSSFDPSTIRRGGTTRRGGRAGHTLRVVDVAKNVAPETFPESFRPREKARYALEVNAGVAARAGVRVGDTVTLAR